MAYKMIDLCAGIGGIRRGFELAKGFKNVLSAEIDKYACMTYEHLYGDDPQNDITTEEFKQKVENTEYDVLLAGFPCQAFSRAGRQQGFLDTTRGTLFFDIADIIRRTSPKTFLLENVDNLITHDDGHTFETIINILVNELDYKVIGVKKEDGKLVYDAREFVRNSRNFGVPQNRPRVYIIGFNREYWGNFVDELPDKLPTKRKKKIYGDLNDVLEMNAEPEFYLASGYLQTLERHRERHASKGNGFGYKIVNEPEIAHPVSNALLATGGSGKERNLVIDEHEGIAGVQMPNKKTPLNDRGIRMMTPREWGKLQGFIGYAFVNKGIDSFSFPEGVEKAQQYKQFGNAVTVPAVEEMAKFMKKCLKQLEEHKMKGNKGEWSEVYAFCYLLNSGVLKAADRNLNARDDFYFPIIKILRREAMGLLEYHTGEQIRICHNDDTIMEFNRTDLEPVIDLLLEKIHEGERAFEIPESRDFFETIKVTKLKADSQHKQDIDMEIHDVNTGISLICGFSIKSYLGANPTLVNPGKTTNFIYDIDGCTDDIMEEVNGISTRNKLQDRMQCLISHGCRVICNGDMVSQQFRENLEFVDSVMPKILGEALLIAYSNTYSEGRKRVKNVIAQLKTDNPLNFSNSNMYEYKFKKLLCSCALGMTSERVWEGQEDANGGYIVVKKDGDVVCYHLYNRVDFEQYLFDYTNFDTPSSSRYEYMQVYKEDGKYKIKLNLQVRFV